jgi:predicted aldo/keto reductase-like oxidoreductase
MDRDDASRDDARDARAASAPTRSEGAAGPRYRRRDVLHGGLAALAGSVGLSLAGAAGRVASAEPAPGAAASSDPPRVRGRPTLGRTGLRISDVSMGTGALGDPKVLRHAYDRGIRYFDTADGYPLGFPGHAEKLIGRELGGDRQHVVLATKTNLPEGIRKEALMQRLEASLRRLRTDYVDVYFNQAVNHPERVLNPEWPEFVARAKEQGKMRWSGMSGHGGRLIECLDLALDRDLVDVILVAYNFGQDPAFYERLTRNFDIVANQAGLPRVLAEARAKGVGILAMKTLMGARLNDMRPWEKDGRTYAQAAIRWVLSNPDVDGLLLTMKTQEQVDEYVGASGAERVGAADLELLERYVAMHGASQCRLGCAQCESSCPAGVRVSDVLRSRMYAVDYGEPAMGRASYAGIEVDASACATCADTRCVAACPYDLPVSSLTRSADALLRRA